MVQQQAKPHDKKWSDQKPSNEYVLNVAFYSFVGFMLFQAGFAIYANSSSMLADCEAMAVDAMTYLFNLCAERIKNKPLTAEELAMSAEKRSLKREEMRLWLELIPPAVSVACLIAIVILTLVEATKEYLGQADGDDDDVSVPIMLIFSGANLLLDFVNVACFARSGSTFGMQSVRDEQEEIVQSIQGLSHRETQALLAASRNDSSDSVDNLESGNTTQYGSMQYTSARSSRRVSATVANLNMCSAWTVSHCCYWNGNEIERMLGLVTSFSLSLSSLSFCSMFALILYAVYLFWLRLLLPPSFLLSLAL